MLKKENEILLHQLSLEYQNFAKKLLKNIYKNCVLDNDGQQIIYKILKTFVENDQEKKALSSLVDNEKTFIDNTLLQFTPRFTFIKWIKIFTIVNASLMVFAVLFFSFLSPIKLSSPEPMRMGNLITWEKVKDAVYYEIYDQEKLIERTTENYFDLTKYKVREFELTVKATRIGRYIDSQVKMKIYINKLYLYITDHDYKHTYIFNNLYCIEKNVFFDTIGQVNVYFKPLYNGYYNFEPVGSSFTKIKTIDGNDVILQNLQGWLNKDTTYIIELADNNGYTPRLMIGMQEFNQINTSAKPGDSIYQIQSNTTSKKSWDTDNDNISFAYLKTLTDEPVFTKQLFIYEYTGFIIIRNDSIETQNFNYLLNEQTFNQESGILVVKPGYNNINFQSNLSIKLTANQKLTLFNTDFLFSYDEFILKPNGFYEFFVYKNGLAQYICYNPTDEDVVISYNIY